MEFSKEFVGRLLRRDEHAFSTLYQQMVDRLYRFLVGRYRIDRQTAYDVIADFFVKLRQRLDRIDVEQSLESWIWTMFRNFVIDYFKTQKMPVRLDDTLETEDTDIEHPAQYTEKNHQLKQIYMVLGHLDDVSKEIVLLRYVEQLSFEEIATITNMQEDAIRQRASRAVKKLQSLL